jgi:hypothetical protein
MLEFHHKGISRFKVIARTPLGVSSNNLRRVIILSRTGIEDTFGGERQASFVVVDVAFTESKR